MDADRAPVLHPERAPLPHRDEVYPSGGPRLVGGVHAISRLACGIVDDHRIYPEGPQPRWRSDTGRIDRTDPGLGSDSRSTPRYGDSGSFASFSPGHADSGHYSSYSVASTGGDFSGGAGTGDRTPDPAAQGTDWTSAQGTDWTSATSRYRSEPADTEAGRRAADPNTAASYPGTPASAQQTSAYQPASPVSGAAQQYPGAGRDYVSGRGRSSRTGATPVVSSTPSGGEALGAVGGGARDPGAQPAPAVYHTRRTGLATAVTAGTAALELPMLLAFVTAVAASPMRLGSALASLLMVLGLPFFAAGMFAALGGAAAVPGQGVQPWFRTPLAYLPVGLVLFLAAAIAAG